MKMPLWGKTESGQIEPFPYHLLERLSDGTLGFKFSSYEDPYQKNRAFGKFRGHFEWNPVGPPDIWPVRCEYRLKHQ